MKVMSKGVFLGWCALIASILPVGCEDDSLCEQICDCRGCDDADLDRCKEELADAEAAAATIGCEAEFEHLIECSAENNECVDDDLQTGPECAGESVTLSRCVEAAEAACPYEGDGSCDEPEGSALCAEDTDRDDCECAWRHDGTCDEPVGTGLCAEHTDPEDCASIMECPYEHDGECDEPEGTNLCAEATDPDDCYCPFEYNDICNEPAPEGDGYCADGTDPADCQ